VTTQDVIAAIRADHLKANVSHHEFHQGIIPCVIHWDRASVDRGGTIFGLGPYLHVPVACSYFDADEETVIRVYPTARLRRKLSLALGYPA
jgi:hypothetical protein